MTGVQQAHYLFHFEIIFGLTSFKIKNLRYVTDNLRAISKANIICVRIIFVEIYEMVFKSNSMKVYSSHICLIFINSQFKIWFIKIKRVWPKYAFT